MNIYLIHAMEGLYHGTNGIEDARIIEAENSDQLESIGAQMSLDIMESYGDVEEMLLDNVRSDAEFMGLDEEEDADEIDAMLNEEYQENIEYYIYELSTVYTVERYEEILENDGVEEVLKYKLG